LLKQATDFAEKSYLAQSTQYLSDRGAILCLQALIFKETALRTSMLATKERLYTMAADRYLKALDSKGINSLETEVGLQFATRELLACQDFILNGPKSRNRTGNCVYFVAGSIVKEGGGYKNWKQRWLVVDDGSVGRKEGQVRAAFIPTNSFYFLPFSLL
jgi:hypothetical protein